MVFEVGRPEVVLLVALAVAIAIGVWIALPPPLSRRRSRISLAVRCLMIALIGGALADLQFASIPSSQSLVVAADLSASTQPAIGAEADAVRAIVRARSGGDRIGVVTFGSDPQVEAGVGTAADFARFQSKPSPHFTDISAALRLAAGMMPNDTRRHVVLLSDGRANLGDAVAEARLLKAEGVRVDALPVQVIAGPEVYVDQLLTPSVIQPGDQAQARATVVSNVATAASARWYLDRTLVRTQQISIPVGQTSLTQNFAPTDPGFHALRLVIDPSSDTYVENNLGEGLVQVIGTSRVLLVHGDSTPTTLIAALESVGMKVDSLDAAQFPRTLSQLGAYQGVVLANVSSSQLSTENQTLLGSAVKDLGTGLVVIGGADSYGPGGYAGTPLESMLPVKMELPKDTQKPPVSVVLCLETTESPQGDAVLRGAAEAVIDQLTPEDRVGITNGTMAGDFIVPLAPLTDKAAVKHAIEAMDLGDPASYAPDLGAAEQALNSTSSSVKHIILLGDGDAYDNYQSLVVDIRAHGITLSTVAVGAGENDAQSMADMASWGRGRFYQSSGAEDVPAILLKETREALKPWIVEGNIKARVGSLQQIFPGLDLQSLPSLTGYVATTPKSAVDTILKSAQGDPLLSTWQYGLGRVVAWTSDAEGRWTQGLLGWADANRFFGGIVRYALPGPGDPALQVETQVQGDHTHLLVTAPVLGGSEVTVSAVAPDLAEERLSLSSTGPGRYEGDVRTDKVGGYILHLTQSQGGATKHSTVTGLSVPYSPEYRRLGVDLGSLQAIASAGGGTVLAKAVDAFAVPVPPLRASLPIEGLLLALAALLLPIDIALRRLILSGQSLATWREGLKTRPKSRPVRESTPTTQLRERVEDIRLKRRASGRRKPG